VTILSGAAGKSEAHWDVRLGEIVRTDLTRSPKTNWSLAPGRCSTADRQAINEASRLVHVEHPYVSW
jgi:hypothetical protein